MIFDDVQEGYGANAIGGIGGELINVTNLNDSGLGSFREALQTAGPRIIKFKISGTIELESMVEVIGKGSLTIDGSDAPQGGICIKGEVVKFTSSDDIIIRYTRFRPGLAGASDSLTFVNCQTVMLDHCSLSWAMDENLGISNSQDITIQWCIISEALRAGPSYAVLVTSGADRITFHHNLLAHNRDRTPYIKCGIVDYRNNINYNSFVTGYCGSIDEPTYQINYIGNMRISGPEANKPWSFKIIVDNVDPDLFLTGKVYLEGNIDGRRTNNTQDENLCLDNYPVIPDQVIDSEINMPSVRTTSAFRARSEVLAYSGASLPRRDAVDQRIINDVIDGTGSSISDPLEVGGWPDLTDWSCKGCICCEDRSCDSVVIISDWQMLKCRRLK